MLGIFCWPSKTLLKFLPCLDVRTKQLVFHQVIVHTLKVMPCFVVEQAGVNFGKPLALLCISIAAMALSSILYYVFTVASFHKVNHSLQLHFTK